MAATGKAAGGRAGRDAVTFEKQQVLKLIHVRQGSLRKVPNERYNFSER